MDAKLREEIEHSLRSRGISFACQICKRGFASIVREGLTHERLEGVDLGVSAVVLVCGGCGFLSRHALSVILPGRN